MLGIWTSQGAEGRRDYWAAILPDAVASHDAQVRQLLDIFIQTCSTSHVCCQAVLTCSTWWMWVSRCTCEHCMAKSLMMPVPALHARPGGGCEAAEGLGEAPAAQGELQQADACPDEAQFCSQEFLHPRVQNLSWSAAEFTQ